MWWVKDNPDHSRGGFQDRDVGKTSFNRDFGPDYGVDYARFSDPPDIIVDQKMKEEIGSYLSKKTEKISNLTIIARNGFIILKGEALNTEDRTEVEELARGFEGVREVINQISIKYQRH